MTHPSQSTGESIGAGPSAEQPRVLVYNPITTMPWSYDVEREDLAAAGADLVVPADPQEQRALLATVDAVILSGALPRADLDALTRCCGICCYSVGMDGVDGQRAAELGIAVSNVPDYCTEEVSDHGVALLLALQRVVVPFAIAGAAGQWDVRGLPEFYRMRRLAGQTVGVIGAGRIGSRLAAKCRGLGMTTISHDPDPATEQEGLPRVGLVELAERSDAVVLCAALTPGGRHLIDAEFLSHVRPHVLLVNVARGPFIDERALAEALNSGRLRGAALDVREVEPTDPATDPLLSAPNVLLTQHVASSSIDSTADIHRLAAGRVIELLRAAGRLPQQHAA